MEIDMFLQPASSGRGTALFGTFALASLSRHGGCSLCKTSSEFLGVCREPFWSSQLWFKSLIFMFLTCSPLMDEDSVLCLSNKAALSSSSLCNHFVCFLLLQICLPWKWIWYQNSPRKTRKLTSGRLFPSSTRTGLYPECRMMWFLLLAVYVLLINGLSSDKQKPNCTVYLSI